VVLAAGDELGRFQPLLDADRLHFLTRSTPDDAGVQSLLATALLRILPASARGIESPGPSGSSSGDGEAVELATAVRRVAACGDLPQALAQVGRDAAGFAPADAADCWIFDPDGSDVLLTADAGGERRVSAAAGIASFVARTGEAVVTADVASEPRHDPDVDGGAGAKAPLAAVPLGRVPGGLGNLGALVARRAPGGQPFGADDVRRLTVLAERVAPLLHGLADERRSVEGGVGAGVFRRAALDHHSRGLEHDGRPLEMTPIWMVRTYRLLLGMLAAALAFVTFGHHDEYAAGPAVVRFGDRVDVTARFAGTASSVEVEPGQQVDSGQVLARFHDQREAAELRRQGSELEALLAERLRDPSDLATARAVANLRAAQELARARLEERVLRAPRAGRVAALRLREGQAVAPGDVVVSLGGSGDDLSVLALLPGHARPQLRPGMDLRLELEGYRYAYQQLVIERVGDEVLGPAEAARLLPPAVADGLRPSGPVVFVHARLPRDAFEVDGRRYAFHDGMLGRAEARTHRERLLVTLVPALRGLGGGAP
ncbi:MAG: HlyD family efflux transporter periplasmic adaptor subunit, partial [Acidobacteriota bacterium]